MPDEQPDGGSRAAGHIVLVVELVAGITFLVGLGFASQATRNPDAAMAAAVTLFAACLGFGMLANAVLRR